MSEQDRDRALAGLRLVPARRPGQWLSAAVVVLLVGLALESVVTNPCFQWGLGLTLWLTAAVMVSGYLIGIGLAAMRLSSNPVLRTISFGSSGCSARCPPLVQLLFWYELASLYPRLSLGIPFVHESGSVDTATLFSGLLAAYVALTLDIGAFAAEIVRGGSRRPASADSDRSCCWP